MSPESARSEQGQEFKFPKKEAAPVTVGEAEQQAEQVVSDVVGKVRESDEVRSRREDAQIDKARRNAMHGGLGTLGAFGTQGAEKGNMERSMDDVSGVPSDVLQAWNSFSDSDERFDALKLLGVPDKENMNINSAKDLVTWSKKKRGFFGSIKDAFSQNPLTPEQTLNLFASQNSNKDNTKNELSADARAVVKNAATQKKAEASPDRSGQGGLTR